MQNETLTPMYADATPIAADKSRERLDEIAGCVIGAGQRVSSVLGYGFLEKIYENALAIEIRLRGLQVEQQGMLRVTYCDEVVGNYVTDLLVEQSVIVEVKATEYLDKIDRAQCVHYLRATGLRVCLLMNFGRPRLEFRRFVANF